MRLLLAVLAGLLVLVAGRPAFAQSYTGFGVPAGRAGPGDVAMPATSSP